MGVLKDYLIGVYEKRIERLSKRSRYDFEDLWERWWKTMQASNLDLDESDAEVWASFERKALGHYF